MSLSAPIAEIGGNMGEMEDAKAIFGEITEGVLFIGKVLNAGSRSDIYALLEEHSTVTDEDLIDKLGLICKEASESGTESRASHYRLFLDRLYLSKNYYFDNMRMLDRIAIEELLSIYNSRALEKRVRRLLEHD